jgi:hypothetical protein
MSEANSSRVRGCGLSIGRNPSPTFAASQLRHPLPQGEREKDYGAIIQKARS